MRDLAAIVLKCVEKAPKNRYSSATELAAELSHWLAGEPVLARPRNRRYCAGSFLRKHARVVAAGFGLLLRQAAVVVGLIVFNPPHEPRGQEAANVSGGSSPGDIGVRGGPDRPAGFGSPSSVINRQTRNGMVLIGRLRREDRGIQRR